MRITIPFSFLLLGVAVLLTGCGGDRAPGVQVTAVVVKNGQPFVAPEKYDPPIVTFVGKAASGRSVSAPGNFDKQKNTYDFPGPTGHGLPPGQYHITVRCTPYTAGDEKDLFKGAFLIGPDSTKPRTPLTCTIAEGKAQEVTIDVGTKQVTVK